MRNEPLEECLRQLRQARQDLSCAEKLAGLGAYQLACCLTQQVAEKALLAYLFAQGEEGLPGGSVESLCAAAAAYDEAFGRYGDSWRILDSYHAPTCDPSKLPEGIPADAFPRASALAAEAITTVQVRVIQAGSGPA